MQQGLNHQLVVRLSQTFFVDQTYYFGLLWGEEESSFFQVESLENQMVDAGTVDLRTNLRFRS